MDECRAENCKAKHPHKRYCLRGHDTFETGRYSTRCRSCQQKPRSTICRSGRHDMDKTGKRRSSRCLLCGREDDARQRERQKVSTVCAMCGMPCRVRPTLGKHPGGKFCSRTCASAARRRSICLRGHNRAVVGVKKDGTCKACALIKARSFGRLAGLRIKSATIRIEAKEEALRFLEEIGNG